MGEIQEQCSMWAIIPSTVRYDRTLPANAKLLYAEIAAKCNTDNICYMYNKTIADALHISADSVSRLLKRLESAGYIVIHIDDKQVNKSRRLISLTAAPYVYSPSEGGIGKNAEGGIGKNAEGVSAKMPRPIENSNTENNTPISPKGERRAKRQVNWKPERFEAFWNFYPPVNGERPAKGRAMSTWDKLRLDDHEIDSMARYLQRKKSSEPWTRGIGIPYASSFLNQRMWEAEQVAPIQQPHREERAEW